MLALITTIPLTAQKTLGQNTTTVVREEGCIREPEAYITPQTLATMAYHGYLEKEGIPGYLTFASEFIQGKITGEKVVEAAVKGCLLSDKYGVASHSDYSEDVEQQIRSLVQMNR